MLRKSAKIELLRRVPLFAGCTKRELEEISTIADEIDFPPGKVLIREQERGRSFIVVVEGSVDVRQKGRVVPIRGGSEFFGEIALVTNSPTIATITATTPVHALVITDRAFRNLMKRSPGIQLKVLRSLAERLAPTTL